MVMQKVATGHPPSPLWLSQAESNRQQGHMPRSDHPNNEYRFQIP